MAERKRRARPMMGRPCEIVGGVVVRHVYAADLYSICLRGPGGESIGDDLTLSLLGVKSQTVLRHNEPPLHAFQIFEAENESVSYFNAANMKPGPTPAGRIAARRLIDAAASVSVRIPVAGPGWLETLISGARVFGYLILSADPSPDPVAVAMGGESIADLLLAGGHVLQCGAAYDNRAA